MIFFFRSLIAKKHITRNTESRYIKTYKMMVFFEEAIDSLKFRQNNGFSFYKANYWNFYFIIQVGSGEFFMEKINNL